MHRFPQPPLTTMAKPYARVPLSKADFALVRGAIGSTRHTVFEKWKVTTGDEQAFYRARTDEYDRIIGIFDAILVADTSQDAEPDDDETDEDDENDAEM